MAAFEHAVALGYRYVETDVHTTADGTLVAFHDDVLDRVTDRVGAIADLPWDDVRQARVAGHAIPLLEDILGAWPSTTPRSSLWSRFCAGPTPTTASVWARSPRAAWSASGD
jgi:glycerophosphoryl diester phosphodiesterase